MSILSKKPVAKWIKQQYYHDLWEANRKKKLQEIEEANIPIEAKPPKSDEQKMLEKYAFAEGLDYTPSMDEYLYEECVITPEQFYQRTHAKCDLKPFTIAPVTTYNNEQGNKI